MCGVSLLLSQIGKAVLASSLSLDAPKHIFLMLFMLTDRLDPNSFFKARRHLPPPPPQELASWLTAWLADGLSLAGLWVVLLAGWPVSLSDDDDHQPYYELLPATLSNMPIFWDEEELEFLHGSYLLTQIEERKVGGTAPLAGWLWWKGLTPDVCVVVQRAIEADYAAICDVAPQVPPTTYHPPLQAGRLTACSWWCGSWRTWRHWRSSSGPACACARGTSGEEPDTRAH